MTLMSAEVDKNSDDRRLITDSAQFQINKNELLTFVQSQTGWEWDYE